MHRSTDCVVHSSGNRKTAEHLDIARIIRVALVLDWYVHRDFALLSLPPFAHSYVWASEWSKVPVIKMRIGWNHFLKTLLCLQVVFFQATLKKRIGIYWGECTASQAKLLTDINAQGALNACFLINRQLTNGEHGVDLHKHLLNNRRGNKKRHFVNCQVSLYRPVKGACHDAEYLPKVLSSARVKRIVHELNLHFSHHFPIFSLHPVSRTGKCQKTTNYTQSVIADTSANAQSQLAMKMHLKKEIIQQK